MFAVFLPQSSVPPGLAYAVMLILATAIAVRAFPAWKTAPLRAPSRSRIVLAALLVAIIAIATARAAVPLPACSSGFIEGRCTNRDSWCRPYCRWGCRLTAWMY